MTGTNLTVSDSHVQGDVIYGDKLVSINNNKPIAGLVNAINSIQKGISDSAEFSGYIEELAEYIQDRVGREVIGLEQKLRNGQREDLIDNAVYLKNKFSRLLSKKQLSPSEQKIFVHILASINTAFNHQVRPLILAHMGKSEVDKAVHQFVIEPVYTAIVHSNDEMTSELVLGMLYFLTGKCHLVWDTSC
jgi:hypothetical protein